VTLPAAGPNAEQIAYWNAQMGERWVAQQALLDAQIEPLGVAVMDRAQLAPGQRVLDVGCGCGQTTLQLAERVAPAGSVVGIDVSAVMLERARERAAGLGERGAHIRFENADAQTAALAPCDLVFSRFGVMFFADPPAAFANLRRALAPGGSLAFVCWQGLQHNEWVRVPLMAAAKHLPLPPPAPGAPGPFAFADPARVRGILAEAGFAEIEIEPHERELAIAQGSLDEAVGFLMQLGPLGRVLREAGAAAAELQDVVAQSVREALAPFAGPSGVRMASASWIVTAR
jgi:SAM-dependent methyltransferase